jgi:hypothetical protein
MNYFLGNNMTIDPRYKVTITAYDGKSDLAFSVSGNTQSDFGVSGGNSYDGQGAMLESIANTLANKTQLTTAAKGLYDAVREGATASTGADRMSTIVGSQQVWTGSRTPTFSIDITFVCLNAEDPKENVVTKVNKLMRAVYPDRVGPYLAPPLGYKTSILTDNVSLAGKSRLTIGTWFSASYLIIEDVQFSFSKELNKNGKPIYATGNVVLRPFRQITYQEYIGWFK